MQSTPPITSTDSPNLHPVLGRRSFLRNSGLFGAGLALTPVLALAGCGQDESSDQAEDLSPQLVALFSTDHVIAAGLVQRLPFGLVDQGQPLVGEAAEVTVEVLFNGETIDNVTVSSRIVTHDHPDGDGSNDHEHADILRYFAVRTTLPEPGIYDLVVDVEGHKVSLPVQAFAAEDVRVLLPGQPMPSIETPTFDNPVDIDPLCTRFPDPCPFHRRTLAELLQEGAPLAVLVSTPAVCATAYCGPVLEALIETAPAFPHITMLHIEVYANAAEVNFNHNDQNIRLASSVIELGLEFEPSLFLVGRDGLIRERIDNVYDQHELEEALEGLA